MASDQLNLCSSLDEILILFNDYHDSLSEMSIIVMFCKQDIAVSAHYYLEAVHVKHIARIVVF